MHGQLEPTTDAGRTFVETAERHIADFEARAPQHDRDGSFPHQNIADLVDSGFMAAPAPAELGGLGLTSYLDQGIGVSRLARGCGATAIAVNMHLISTRVMARMWRRRDTLDSGTAAAVEGFLKAIAAKQLITSVPSSEPGTYIAEPMTEASPAQGGWLLNGHKIFGTLSPAANIFFSTARVKREDGTYASALAVVMKGAPGVEMPDNWDALGMRASGSGDVVYRDVRLPEGTVLVGGDWGSGTGAIEMNIAANVSLVHAFIGIGERAQQLAIESVTKTRKGASGKRLAERVPVQQLIAENEVDLYAARAAVLRLGMESDARGDGDPPSETEFDRIQSDHQAMKWIVQRSVINIVDRAMSVCGGAAYMSKHPLSRLYRDARALPFMQPFATYEALEFIGKVTLGLGGRLDR